MEDLKVRITGDVDGLKSAFADAQKAFDSLGDRAKRTQKDLADNVKILGGYENELQRLNNELKSGAISQDKFAKSVARLKRDEAETIVETKRLKKELSDLSSQQKILSQTYPKLGKGIDSVGKSAANAQPTLTEFSRVIQDAPFGIQGVGNNITQLVSQFNYLSRATGGAGAALKALLSSFVGPAGILFAVSTIVSLLTVYGAELFKNTEATNKLAKASAEFVGSAKAEIITLESLLKVARDETQTKEVRLEALDRINKKYSEYLGNLQLEELNTREVTNAVNALSLSLIKQAQVRGANKLIEEETNEIAEEALDLKAKELEANKLAQKSIDDLRKSNATFKEFADTSGSFEDQLRSIAKLAKGTNQGAIQVAAGYINAFRQSEKAVKSFETESVNSLKPLQDILNSLTLEDIQLKTSIGNVNDNEVVVTPKLQKVRDEELKKVQKQYNDLLDGLNKDLELIDQEDVKDQVEAAIRIYESSGARIKDALDLGGQSIFDLGVDETYFELLELEKILDRIKSKLSPEEFAVAQTLDLGGLKQLENQLLVAEAVSKSTTAAIGDVFQGLSGTIGKSVDETSSGLERFTSSLIGSVIKILGVYLSQSIGAAIAGGSAAGAATGPGAVVAIPSLIASLTASVIGAFAAIPSFATGGIVPGGSNVGDKVLTALNSGEMVLNTGQQKQLFNMFNRSGGGEAPGSFGELVLDAVLKGDDIYLSSKRAQRKNNRFGS